MRMNNGSEKEKKIETYLSNERVRLDSSIRVHLWHVHIVYEVDQLLGARWAIGLSCLLLQWLLHDLLQHHG